MSKISLKDFEMYYESHGNGEPLILIPGFASGAWSWEYQMRELSKAFRVISFDPRGISASRFDHGRPADIRGNAADISELLDKIGIDKANVLGISFGGFVAQEFALSYPAKVKKLILACTSFGGANHVAPSPEVLSAFVSTSGSNAGERIRQFLAGAFSSAFARDHSDAVERFCMMRESNPVPEHVYLDQLRSAMEFDAEERLPHLSLETLVLTGDLDLIVPMLNSVNLAAAIPNCSLTVIENAGHMAFVENAAEFNAIVRDFLS